MQEHGFSNPSSIAVFGGEHCMTLVLWFFPVSLRSQNEGNEGNMLHSHKIVLLAKPHNAVQGIVKPRGLQQTHLCWFVQIQGWQDVSQNLLFFPPGIHFCRRLQTIQMERLLMRKVKQNRSENKGGIRKKLGRGREDKQQREREGLKAWGPVDLVASFENRLFGSSRSHEGKLWYWMRLCWTLIIQRSPSQWLSSLVSSPSQYSIAEIVFLTPKDSLTPPTQHGVKLCNLLCKSTPSPKWSCTTYFCISPHFLVLLSLSHTYSALFFILYIALYLDPLLQTNRSLSDKLDIIIDISSSSLSSPYLISSQKFIVPRTAPIPVDGR